MKKVLLFFILFAGLTLAQNYSKSDSLKSAVSGGAASDTVYVAHMGNPHVSTCITYTDSGATYTDTVYVYTSAGSDSSTGWVKTGLKDLLTNEVIGLITNVNATKKYELLDSRARWIKIILGNEQHISGRKGTFVIEVK